jgi:hypothetical protein
MTERGRGEGDATGRIEDDHRELRSRLDALTNKADRAGVLSSLHELPKMLGEHFADEEVAGGLYEELARRNPGLEKKLDALRQEHRELLQELEALGGELPSAGGADSAIDEDLQRSIDRCADRLRRHEHAESEMIADVYYSDEGGRG